jgi:uncharacterized protein (DUF302 family)
MKMCLKLLTLFFWLAPAMADEMLVSRPSAHDVQTTMDRLETIVKEKGMTVFARIDHQANATGAGMDMPAAQVLIFGKPEAGTKMMQADVRAGLDLPLRVLVYAGDDGRAHLLYHDPRALVGVYALEGHPVPEKVAGALDKMTSAASAE